jgi:hypothetical protein
MDALFIFFNGYPPLPGVGKNELFSGYKSQRTKGQRGD